MWYFAWVLGVTLAVSLGILNVLWGEFEEDRKQATDNQAGVGHE
jgi:cyd operon protein YbgT